MAPMRRLPGCPTCGWHWGAVRVRRGRIARIPAGNASVRYWRKKGEPQKSTRVYWPQKRYGWGRTVALCPDPYHMRRAPMYPLRPEGESEPYTGLNRHDPEVKDRRKTKARRHREHQSKERR
jgi:hypothetical protein